MRQRTQVTQVIRHVYLRCKSAMQLFSHHVFSTADANLEASLILTVVI